MLLIKQQLFFFFLSCTPLTYLHIKLSGKQRSSQLAFAFSGFSFNKTTEGSNFP